MHNWLGWVGGDYGSNKEMPQPNRQNCQKCIWEKLFLVNNNESSFVRSRSVAADMELDLYARSFKIRRLSQSITL